MTYIRSQLSLLRAHQQFKWLVGAGYSVLAYDFRNHGESGEAMLLRNTLLVSLTILHEPFLAETTANFYSNTLDTRTNLVCS